MSKVHIWHTEIQAPLAAEAWARLLARADADTQARVQAFRRWQDAHATLIGRAMVAQALGLAAVQLPTFAQTPLHRPHLPGYPDFNISHSDGVVVVAVASHGRVGIDVERLRPMAIEEAQEVFTATEWRTIDGAADRNREFFRQWTLKEAVMKADGRGFHLAPTEIVVSDGCAHVQGATWHVSPMDLGEELICHIATSLPIDDYEICSFFFDI